MYLMYLVIRETLHTRACAHAHVRKLLKSRYIRYIGLFPLVNVQKHP